MNDKNSQKKKTEGRKSLKNLKKMGRISRLKGLTKYMPSTIVKSKARPGHSVKLKTEKKKKKNENWLLLYLSAILGQSGKVSQ